MAYELVTTQFRTELHARWSIFFDYLEVPWQYEPVTFRDSKGASRTPAFWLPREHIWFHAELESPPPWWARFASATSENQHYEHTRHLFGDHQDTSLIEVGERWYGKPLLALGWIPDGWGAPDQVDGPWRFTPHMGMLTADDACYQWTLCPQCGSFGAEFWGYAERLECGCLDDREHRKVVNGGDSRLMLAYRAAEEAGFKQEYEDGLAHLPMIERINRPAVRESVVRRQDAFEAPSHCVGECRSLAEVFRAGLPSGVDVGADLQESVALCGACPGFVCALCGKQPAPLDGAACQVCEPVPPLTEGQARTLLNDKLTDLARVKKEPLRAVHPQANRYMGVRRRHDASLEQIVNGLNQAEQWLEDPDTFRTRAKPEPLSDREVNAMGDKELRSAIAQRLGPLCAAVGGEAPPLVQLRINDAMGVTTRSAAGEEQLREGLLQVQRWIGDPDTYREPAAPRSASVLDR